MDWIRKNHIIWKKIGITAGVYLGMKYLVPLLIPFFIAALLVCWCWPLLQWAQRRLRIKPAFVMAVLLILAAALLAGLGIWLGKSIGELARRLAEMAHEDTGFGKVEDKIIKNIFMNAAMDSAS